MHCGDTSFFIDLFDPERNHHDAARAWYEAYGDQPLFAPAVSIWELYRGTVRVSEPYTSEVRRFLRDVETLPLAEDGALEAARIEQETRNDGVQLAKADCLIAGIVRGVGGTIITSDRDFDRVQGLRCANYVARE